METALSLSGRELSPVAIAGALWDGVTKNSDAHIRGDDADVQVRHASAKFESLEDALKIHGKLGLSRCHVFAVVDDKEQVELVAKLSWRVNDDPIGTGHVASEWGVHGAAGGEQNCKRERALVLEARNRLGLWPVSAELV